MLRPNIRLRALQVRPRLVFAGVTYHLREAQKWYPS